MKTFLRVPTPYRGLTLSLRKIKSVGFEAFLRDRLSRVISFGFRYICIYTPLITTLYLNV